jgi:hypothetical protein
LVKENLSDSASVLLPRHCSPVYVTETVKMVWLVLFWNTIPHAMCGFVGAPLTPVPGPPKLPIERSFSDPSE